MILNTYAQTQLMCCFCENLISATENFCGGCGEYKGIMTVAQFQEIYGEDY